MISGLSEDLNIIQKLDTLPNAEGGLTAEDLKRKFDESGLIIQEFINEVIIPAINYRERATEEEIDSIREALQALDDDIAESVVNLTHAKITVTKTGDAYTANMTYEEVSTALAEGRTLYCSYGGLLLPYLRSITAGPHVFACIDGTNSYFVQILPSEVLFDHKILATQEEIPDTLPNPHKLTFTGAVEAVYDGSEAVTVPIPSGTDKDVLLLADRQTGRVYRLFAENGQLKMTAGDGIGGMDCVTLTDRQTGRVYELFVHDGELKMTE